MAVRWVMRWGMEMATDSALPGVWRRRAGGYIVRARVTNPKTGRLTEVLRALPDAPSATAAFAVLQEEREKVRNGRAARATATPTFKSFAASVFRSKVDDGTIRSGAGRVKWSNILAHHLDAAPFATYYLDKITHSDVSAWRNSLPTLTWKRSRTDKQTGTTKVFATGAYSPHTMNDFLAVARVIFGAATLKYDLARNPMVGVEDFSLARHRVYTHEEPNSLTPAEASVWLSTFKDQFPQFFAMTFLGLVLGQRPSTLRPLRRRGPTPDLDLANRVLLVRRSHTIASEVMDSTKTGKDQTIKLPPALMDVLTWHIETQLTTWQQKKSELLFPTEEGGFRSRSCLDKPFAAVTAACGIRKRITPRAMRRTFQDLSREAQVEGIVAKAISGHATDAMRLHYSTAQDAEVEQGIARVIDIASRRQKPSKRRNAKGS